MKLVVGLGNPGLKYKKTKHNIGFMSLDYYAKQNKLKFKKDNKFRGEWLKDGNLVLLKPHTFMNVSGESIKKMIDFYNIDIEDVLIVFDDLSLPFSKIRLREKGSAGGHNGIKSIINHLHTQEFKRVKVGIDSNPLIETKNYVLGKFTKNELNDLESTFSRVSNLITDFAKVDSFVTLMTKYN